MASFTKLHECFKQNPSYQNASRVMRRLAEEPLCDSFISTSEVQKVKDVLTKHNEICLQKESQQ